MKKFFAFLMTGLILSGSALFGGSIIKTFNFSESELIFERYENYLIVKLKGYSQNYEVGAPCLPLANYQLVIPPTAEVTNITIEDAQAITLAGDYLIMPTPEFQPISLIKGPIVIPNEDIYQSDTPYPRELIRYYHTGTKSGYRVCGLGIMPFQYYPKEQRLVFYTKLTVRIDYEEAKILPIKLTQKQKQVFSAELKKIVVNPYDLERFSPPLQTTETECNYLIITVDSYLSAFEPLVRWRTKQGYRGEITTINTIALSYPGRDIQEKMRNAIKDYYQNRGLIFVVLGGDSQLVEPRIARVVASSYTGNIPCDLYYSDLDGTWDANNNNIFGEVPGDNVDMYPDVYVGRASVDNLNEVNTFVNKIFTFEKNPPTDYFKRILLPSVMLFSQYNYHGRIVNDSIALITPASWTDRLLIDPPNTTPMRESLNNGFLYCHVSAHGDEVGFYYQSGTPIYTRTDAYAQTNGNRLFVLNAIACNSGDFGYGSGECLAEAMMNNSNGGAVATIQNSRYGWGNPPNLGPSERIDVKFYDFLINRDSFLIGAAHARSKAIFTPQANSDPVTRWCVYELNLFGDPAMPLWTEIPQTIVAQYPQVVPLGPSNFNIQVTRNGLSPITNALVCIEKPQEIYAYAYTNSAGIATIPITPITPGRVYLTITAQNCYPYEDSIVAQANGPYVGHLRSIVIDSTNGNGDGIINPGEEINLRTWVKNYGNETAQGILGYIRNQQNYINVVDSIKSFGTIPAYDSAFSGLQGYRFMVAPNCTNGMRINFQLYCRDIYDSTWVSIICLRIGTPRLFYRAHVISDPPPANNNGRLDPNETANLYITLLNSGYGNGYNVSGILRSFDSRLIVIDSTGNFGTVYAETTGSNYQDPFVVYASNNISPGTLMPCSLYITAAGNYTTKFGINLIVGEFRIIDPIPDGPRIPPRYWAYDNIDSIYSQAPAFNWIEIKNLGTRITYDHNDQVRKIPLPQNFVLRFYGVRYDTISVSVDGFIRLGADTTRDYSNSPIPDPDGPAPMLAVKWDDLYHSNTGSYGGIWWYYHPFLNAVIVEWDSVYYYNATSTRDKFQVIIYDSTAHSTHSGDNIIIYQYLTANLNNSATVGIEDHTETIGIQYLYNGSYHPAAAGLVPGRAIKFITDEPTTDFEEYQFQLVRSKENLIFAFPNPFKSSLTIKYLIRQPGNATIKIYDATGRVINTLFAGKLNPGSYTVNWNGQDSNGQSVTHGIYFVKLTSADGTALQKFLFIK
ncbi:MAG: C25 family cysteine peptidase [candidate division WOR-3 bacterium]